jgi:hypothetical protein
MKRVIKIIWNKRKVGKFTLKRGQEHLNKSMDTKKEKEVTDQ